MRIPQEIRKLIESGTPAHLVTLNQDGSPQLTMVWIGLDGDECSMVRLRSKKGERLSCYRDWLKSISKPV
jgi:hypothetical protein